jgi:hypothetical protein
MFYFGYPYFFSTDVFLLRVDPAAVVAPESIPPVPLGMVDKFACPLMLVFYEAMQSPS